MRDLDPAILEALQQGALKERKFYTITAPPFGVGATGTAHFWNDLGLFTCFVVDGIAGVPVERTFTGSGTLISCSAVPLTADLNPRNVTITLNQTDRRIDSLVRGYNLRNAYCQIHSGLFDPQSHAMISPGVCEFTGFVDGCTIRSPSAGSAGSVELRIVSHTRETTRAGYATRSQADQQFRNASDTLMKYTSIIGAVQIYWYEKRLALASAPSGSAVQSGQNNTVPVLSRFR